MSIRLNKTILCSGACLFLTVFMNCNFMDLRPIKYSITPSSQNTILASAETPVSIQFETEMRRSEVEKILNVSSGAGQTEGDIIWQANKLLFYAAGGWKPGVRYTLKFEGVFFAKDGREDKADDTVHFYAATNSKAPVITNFSPADGESTGVTPQGGARLSLLFSCDMNKISVEDALVIEGVNETDRRIVWISGHEVEVTSIQKLNAWTNYRWTLGKEALSAEGVAISKPYSAAFITNSDMVLPKVQRVFPMINSGNYWSDTGLSIRTGLGFGHGIGIDFSKDMDAGSALRGVQIEPALQGRVEQLTPRRFVFIPDKAPEPSKRYMIVIRGETKDSFGLALNDDYKIDFIPDIKFLKVKSIYASGSATGSGADDDYIEDAAVTDGALLQPRISAADKNCILEIEFSMAINAAQKAVIPNLVNFAPHFPQSLRRTDTQSINWKSDFILEIEFVNLVPGTAAVPHYYKLNIPGGSSGIQNGTGDYLENSLSIYLEARP